jgi:glycosyltransferase involved in cell wall biosynthesis
MIDLGKVKGIQYVAPVLDGCYDEETEVLTDRGWIYFKELSYKDKLCTLNKKGELHYVNPLNIIQYNWDGPMYRFYSYKSCIDLLVTPDHNLYVQNEHYRRKADCSGWNFEKAEECFGKYRFFKKNGKWKAEGLSDVLEVANKQVKTEDWLEFLGYYLSEGSSTITKSPNHYVIQIRQLGENIDKMAKAFISLGFGKINIKRNDGRILLNNKDLCLYLKKEFGNKYEKNIPQFVLNKANKRQLLILFDALMLGDGSYRSGGKVGTYYTSSKKLRDNFMELLLKIGYSGSYKKRHSKGDTIKVFDRECKAKEDHWAIRIRFKRNVCSKPSKDSVRAMKTRSTIEEWVTYKGKVYCATVPNHTLYIRRGGFPVWCGNSGYAHASRDYILALHGAGVPVTIKPVSFEHARPDYGEEEKVIESLVNKEIDYNINLIHLTPEHIPLYKENNKFNVNLSIWETDKLHPMWPGYCNSADAVIVPCEWNIGVYKNSGVTPPMGLVPHCLDVEKYNGLTSDKLLIDGVSKDDFVFHTISQWTARKNFIGLIRAYIGAFVGVKDVVLAIKTYKNDTSPGQQKVLLDIIKTIKFNVNLEPEEYPKIVFIGHLLSEEDIVKLHNRGDCYVSLAHSEGWGLGFFEAMAMGKPTIGVGGSGNEQFMKKDNSFLVDYTWGPVYGMPYFRWYRGDQLWPEPDLKHAMDHMKFVYRNREEALKIAARGKEYVINNFSRPVIAETMVKELNRLLVETSI